MKRGADDLGGFLSGLADPLNAGDDDEKRQKGEPREKREGDWTCASCGNTNYGDRLFCNMRSCGKPKDQADWTCPSCGNTNFPDRMVCNMRKCRAVRPGAQVGKGDMMGGKASAQGFAYMPVPHAYAGYALAAQAYAQGAQGGGYMGGYMGGGYMDAGYMGGGYIGGPMMAAGHAGGKAFGGKGVKGKDWICPGCSNSNFSDRAFCNMRKCGAARQLTDWVCDKCGNNNFKDRLTCNMRKCGADRIDPPPQVVHELLSKGMGKGK